MDTGQETGTHQPANSVWQRIAAFARSVKGSDYKLEPFYRFCARGIAKAIYRPEYIGFERIPKEGPVMLIANHVSYVDGLIVASGCPRPVRFLIDGFIYNLPGVHYFMKLNRAIPIIPKRDSVIRAFDDISAGLKAGDAICIFPEGQLTYTGSLGRFRPGIESIIKRNPMPVYPIAITGLWGSVFSRKYIKSIFRFVPRGFPSKVKAVCGEPIPPEKVTVANLQKAILQLKYSL